MSRRRRTRRDKRQPWPWEHEDEHQALIGLYRSRREPPSLWPWVKEWWKPADRIRNLEKAGALIAAEIDRLLRNATREDAC